MDSSRLVRLVSLTQAHLCKCAVCLILLCLVFSATKLILKWRKMVSAFRDFPALKCHWLYGNIYQFTRVLTNLEVASYQCQLPPYGFSLWVGNLFACLVVTHPDYAKAILSRQDPKDNMAYRFTIPWIGEGLLVSSGQKWNQHRRLLAPAFHTELLKSYIRQMSECTRFMLDKWERSMLHTSNVEVFHDVSLLTQDIFMNCAFNYNSDVQNSSDIRYIEAVNKLSRLVYHRFRSLQYHNDLLYYLSSYGNEFRKSMKEAHGYTDIIIKQRKAYLKNKQKKLQKMIRKKKYLDFLDILLSATDENGQGLSDEDIRAEVNTFMFEGHDSTASGISWTFYSLAKNLEHQQKCREEIREVLGDRHNVEWEDLGKLTYTTWCIKESMRLYTPVPMIARQLSKPITFCDGRSLPSGSVVVVSISSIHRSPRAWRDPAVFDPLRFSPENTADRHSHAYIPFSAGTRNCIGQNFAMNEIKVALALTLQRFELSPDPQNEPIMTPEITLRSENGMHLDLKLIEPVFQGYKPVCHYNRL
ncbi:cytochrome P450 4B1-like [Pelodytes ibericus]